MVEIAQTDLTSDPIFGAIFRAKRINSQAGAAIITPWEVGQLPGEWLDAFDLLGSELAKVKTGLSEFDQFVNDWRTKVAGKKQ